MAKQAKLTLLIDLAIRNSVLEWLYYNIDWLLPAFGTFVTVLGGATAAMLLFILI